MIDFKKQLDEVVSNYIQKYHLDKSAQYYYAGRFPLSACLSFTSNRLEQNTFQFANETIYSDVQQLALVDDWLTEQIGDINSSPQLCLHFKLHQLADQLQQALPLQYKIQDNAGKFFDMKVYMPFELTIDSGTIIRHTILPDHIVFEPGIHQYNSQFEEYLEYPQNVYIDGFIRLTEPNMYKLLDYSEYLCVLDIYGSQVSEMYMINGVMYNAHDPIEFYTSGGVFYSFVQTGNRFVLQHMNVEENEYILNYPVQYRKNGAQRVAYLKQNQIYAPVVSIVLQ